MRAFFRIITRNLLIAVAAVMLASVMPAGANVFTKIWQSITGRKPRCPKGTTDTGPLVITTTSLPDAVVGQPYNFQLQATGGCR